MTLTRLLVAALLMLSASAFAQKQIDSASRPEANSNQQAAEPWKLEHTQPITAKDPLDRMQIDQFRVDPKAAPFKAEARLDPIVVTPEDTAGDTGLCYTIRSYVVARDSKDSDSVHPVGYSTCQPAGKYRLKTAEMHRSSR